MLTHKQFGFRPQRSTQDVLNIVTNYIHINKATGYKTALITKDVERAFDTVWHEGLRYKICTKFNFPRPLQKLLCNFLHNRKMQIRFCNHLSEKFRLNAGVPQGSVLSPTLFTMYTNDMPGPRHPHSLTLQYADDVTTLVRAYQFDFLSQRAQQEIDHVTQFELIWRIKTNPNKSQITYFKHRRGPGRPYLPVYINRHSPNRTPIPIATNNTVLGVTFDNTFRIHKHVIQKAAIARKTLIELYRFRTANIKTKLHLYKALVRPQITYAPNTIALAAKTNTLKLQRVQNQALRWIYNTKWDDFQTSESLHQRANMPPLNIYLKTLGDKQIERLLLHHETYASFLDNLDRLNTNIFHKINDPPPDPIYVR